MAIQKPLVEDGAKLSQLAATDRLFTGQDDLVAELAATATVAGTTLADVAGLSFVLKVGTYAFSFDLLITQAGSNGIVGVSVNYTGTVTRVAQSAVLASTATSASFRSNQAINTAMVDSANRATGGPFPTRLAGSITVSTPGTLTLRAQRSAGTTTILLGSSGLAIQL